MDMSMHKHWLIYLAIFGGVPVVAHAADITDFTQAAAAEDLPVTSSVGLHGSIGLGVGTRPEYEGAKDRKTRPAPYINLFYGDTFFLTGMKAGRQSPALPKRAGRDGHGGPTAGAAWRP
jgi:hypothetical protein